MPPPVEPPRVLESTPPDRERDAGFRGDALDSATLLLGAVFVTGLGIVAMVVWFARRPRRDRSDP